MNWLANWKTTAAGLGAICAALADVLTAASHGTITGNLAADATGVIAGVGLIFAKDSTAKK